MSDNRELTPIEQAMEVLNRVAGSFNVVTISRIKGLLSEEIVRQALDLAQHRHPRLNSRIVGSLDSLHFETEGTQKIPLRVVEKLQNEQWQEVVLEELNQKIESSKGLMRAVLVRNQSENSVNYLLTTLHHAITDGLSGIRLHQDILTYCHRIASGEQITQVPSLSALPPVEELLPESMQGFRGRMNGVLFLLRLKFKQLWHRPETLGFEKYVPTDLRRCGMVHRKLDEELTQQLVNRCRNEKTTVQGAMCAAMLLSAARKIRAENETEVRVSCRSYIDLRRHIKPAVSHENLAILASSLTSFHTLQTNTLFWELARDVRRQIEAGLELGDIFSPVPMSRKIIESLLARSNEAPMTAGITNVGQVNIPNVYGSFILEEISFIAAQAAFGGVLAAAVTTFEGKMVLNFMFSEPSISRDTAEKLADNMVACIVEACKETVAGNREPL
jgi:NRPS condensation-like uncharacterized protein